MRIAELSKYDFPKPLIAAWQAQGIEKLLPIQEQAIKRHELFNNGSFIVSAPTSSGKTFIGEMAAVYQGQKRRKTVYLVPLKALAEEKYEHFRKLYEPYGIRIAVSTRDRKEFDEALNNGEFEIAIVVYEKFFQLLNSTPKFLNHVGLVVIDELQLLADTSRGATVELILTRLKMLDGRFQLIGLTAVLGNNRQVNEWLDVDLLHHERRPVELRIGYLWDGIFHYRTYNSQESGEELLLPNSPDDAYDILEEVTGVLAQRGEQSLIFVRDKQTARGFAKRLAKQIDLEPAEEALDELDELEATVSNEELAQVLKRGIAFHHADLTPDERALVERHFRAERIKILVSTTTLAMGVNLPTRNVFIQLEKWHTDPGELRPQSIPLPKSDFENMGGRAGRFQLEDEFGRAMAVLTRPIECDQFRNIYIDGKLEDIQPNLWRDSMATTVLGMVALGHCKSLEDVRGFLRNTLTWHLYRKSGVEQAKLDENLEQGITDCLRVGVLRETKGKKLALTEFGKAISANGVRVETGGILKDWLEQRGDSAFTATEAILAAVITPDGQEAYLNMSTQEYQQIGGFYYRTIHEILGDGAYRLLRGLIDARLDGYQTVKTYKTALLLTDYIGIMSGRELEEHYHTYFGAVKRVAEHISWVLSAAASIAKVLEFSSSWIETILHLAEQVQHGLSQEGVRLAQMRIPRLGRERIRSMIREGAVSDDNILEAGEEFIAKLTTKPVAKRLIKSIKSRRQRQRKDESSTDNRVNQKENHGSVVVGVNTGTIIVGKDEIKGSTFQEDNDIEDLTNLKSTEWRKAVKAQVGELDPADIRELFEKTREVHHNHLRPAFRDAARCKTNAELQSVLEDIQSDYQNLNNLLHDKLSAIVLPDYSHDFKAVTEIKITLDQARDRVEALGNSLLKKVTRLVNLLEEFKVAPESMLLEALESLGDQTKGIDYSGLQAESERLEGFYRRADIVDALSNLLSNTLESNQNTDSLQLTLTSQASEGKTILRIADNGEGIPDSDRDRIFNDGFSTKGSTGFGLGHARKVFESHGGSLRLLDNSPGSGATFEVIL